MTPTQNKLSILIKIINIMAKFIKNRNFVESVFFGIPRGGGGFDLA